MDERLVELARELHEVQKEGHKLSLEYILRQARILKKAKVRARGEFGRWLREQAHMEYLTAERYILVDKFVRDNSSLKMKIASLSIAKVYALSLLDLATAQRYLRGEGGWVPSLERISDFRFRIEFKRRHGGFGSRSRNSRRRRVFEDVYGCLAQLERLLSHGSKPARRWTPGQRERLARKLESVIRLAAGWKIRVGLSKRVA